MHGEVAERSARSHMLSLGRSSRSAVTGVESVISAATIPPARPAAAWRRLWSPERLLGRHMGLRAYQLGLALACLLLLHAVVVNALLFSGALGCFLARATGVLKVETGHSFCVWTGVVHLRQLQLEVKDGHMHFELEVPSGRANILLRELLRRRFVVGGVTGEHFVVRLRPKFRDVPERRLAALPPLSEPETKPATGKQPHFWPVRIEGVGIQTDELWLSELRYLGDARVSGRSQSRAQAALRSSAPADTQLQRVRRCARRFQARASVSCATSQ